MKLVNFLLIFSFFFLVLSCKKNEASPDGLSGTWVLVQKEIREETWNNVTTRTENVPPSPLQTIVFTYPNSFKATILQDTSFTLPHYFQINNGDLTGPTIILYKTLNTPLPLQPVNMFTYNVLPQDTLYMRSLNGSAFTYKFRRL